MTFEHDTDNTVAVNTASRRDDADIVSALQLGLCTCEMFEELRERYYATTWNALQKVHGLDDADRDDLFQEVWIKVWDSRLDGFDISLPLGPYLWRMARNLAISYLRRRNRRREQALPADLPSPARSDDDLPTMDELLGQLDDGADRELLRMQFEDGLKPREIARKVDKTPKQVSSRLYGARQKLKDSIVTGQLHRARTAPPAGPDSLDYPSIEALKSIINDRDNIERIIGDFEGQYMVGIGIPEGKRRAQIIVHVEGRDRSHISSQLEVDGHVYPVRVECGYQIPQLHQPYGSRNVSTRSGPSHSEL